MTVNYKPHQLQKPLDILTELKKLQPKKLEDITLWFESHDATQLRSHRRCLLGTLRYIRTHSVQSTPQAWKRFAETIVARALAYDEATKARYRNRLPCATQIPDEARIIFIRSLLDHRPVGWHSSLQTRKTFQHALRQLPKDFQGFSVINKDAPLEESMRTLVRQQKPPTYSAFIQLLAHGDIKGLINNFWPERRNTQHTHDQWLQAAYALAVFPKEAELKQYILNENAFPPVKPLMNEGISLSFFEMVRRLHPEKPPWLQTGFDGMLANESNSKLIARGWKGSALAEEDRFDLVMNTYKQFPRNFKTSLPSIAYQWTTPMHERKAKALQVYSTPTDGNSDMHADQLLEALKEWFTLVVPELAPIVDLISGSCRDQCMQLDTLIKLQGPAPKLELPDHFDIA